MSDVETQIIETSPVSESPSPLSTEGLSESLAQENAPKPEAKEKSSDTIDEALEKAFAKSQGKEPPEKEEKVEETTPKASQRDANGKFAAPEKEVGEADETKSDPSLQSEGKHVKAPSRLLPSERDVWVNTPRAVQGAFERIEAEHANEIEKHKASSEFYESVKDYDTMAKAANTTVKAALDNYVKIDKSLAADFGRGLAEVAQAYGKNPVEAVAQLMRASGVLPQQLGAYLQGQPARAAQTQQQRPQVDPNVQSIMQEVTQLKQQLAQQQDIGHEREVMEIINTAMPNMPRFKELEDDIAKLLTSGYIDASLSQPVRLREAYFAADRLNPALQKPPEHDADPDFDAKVTTLPRKKQISGSPSASSTRISPKGPAPSIDAALENAFRHAQKR